MAGAPALAASLRGGPGTGVRPKGYNPAVTEPDA
jgi:hypothetical protein